MTDANEDRRAPTAQAIIEISRHGWEEHRAFVVLYLFMLMLILLLLILETL